MTADAQPVDRTRSTPDDWREPFISIIVPVYQTDQVQLAELLASVREQTDPDWELVLVDDGSANPSLTAALAAASAGDARIRHITVEQNSGIVVASNRGLALARGEFVGLLDHDDLIAAEAVESCRSAVRFDPRSDVLYSDETIIGLASEVLGEFRKPVFSPERLRGQMYTGHLGVYRRSLLDSLGGFRQGFDGSQDYDLILRATERARVVQSIPRSLYRWRTLPTSVSHSVGNDYVFDAARRALADHLSRTGVRATVTQTDATGRYRIDRDVPEGRTVSVIVPSVGGRAFVDGADRLSLTHSLQSLLASCGERLAGVTVLLADEQSAGVAGPALDRLFGARGQVQRVTGNPWSSGAVNEAVLAAPGPFVLLIRDGVTALSDRWLEVLLGLALDPAIAIVGPRVQRWDGSVAAAGLAVAGGAVHVIGQGCLIDDPGPFGALQLDREVTALPADCLLIDRRAFLQVGGLSLRMSLPGAVIDLSLKAAEVGYRTVASAACDARVGSSALIPLASELGPLRERWGSRLAADEYWRD